MAALWRTFPDLPRDLALVSTLAALRRGRGLSRGQNVLIVLDQFEHWIFAKGDSANPELLTALRQCDGRRFAMLESEAVAITETTSGARPIVRPAPRFHQDPKTGPRGRLVTNALIFGRDGRQLIRPGRMLIPSRGTEDRQVVDPTLVWSAPELPTEPGGVRARPPDANPAAMASSGLAAAHASG